jgi:IS30 family transposase
MIKNKKAFKHLTLEDREIIYHMRFVEKASLQKISDFINKSKSTISYELSNRRKKSKYIPTIAHNNYRKVLCKKGGFKIDENPKILKHIKHRLINHKWSPDVISAKSIEEIGASISTETIYNYIYNSKNAQQLELYKYLPFKRKNRLKRGSKRKSATIPNRVSISKREAVADNKTEIGHFEVDLTFHKNNRSANMSAMVDKTSQKVILCFNKNKTSNAVSSGLLQRINKIPKRVRKTMTFDNGKEFTNHTNYQLKGFKTYFCNAYSPWQKGLVEKINSMIHRIFPKHIDINKLTKNKLQKIENLLNNMPRKILDYKTPNEVWNEKLRLTSNSSI